MYPGAGVVNEDEVYVLILNYYGMAVILSLSTPIRSNILSSVGDSLFFKSNERNENAKK